MGSCRDVNVVGDVLGSFVIVEDVVGNAEEPCREARHAFEARDVRVGLNKGVLRQVVAQLRVSQRLVQKEPTHRRLVFPDKLVECPLVVEYRHLRYKREVSACSHAMRC